MTYLAIGSTTKALVELLKRKLNKPPLLGTGVTIDVTTLPPDDDRLGETTGINLYLYRIVESPYFKNLEFRGDRSHPASGGRPSLAVNLHYLVTAYAKKVANSLVDDIVGHQVLGNAMSILHDCAVLNDVHDADFDADRDEHFAAELRDSFEKLKVMLVPTSIDEFSKIWTGLSKAYRLSVAYEVSLVELAPQLPAPVPAPRPQRTIVRVAAFARPNIESVVPAAGAVGTEVTLRGSGFSAPRAAPVIHFGGVDVDPADVLRASDRELVFRVPTSVTVGPHVPVSLELQGRKSGAVAFDVTPWLGGLVPLRGPTGIPLRLAFEVPPAETVSATIDGAAVAATVDAATKTVVLTVPAGLATNGPKPVVLTLNGSGSPTNQVSYEVMPRVTGVTLTTSSAPVRTTVSVAGERLAGEQVFVRHGRLSARAGQNTDPAGVEVTFDGALTAGEVVVSVDGRESAPFPPRVDAVEPTQAAAGDVIVVRGAGLSGGDVRVEFDATSVALGPQAFAHELSVVVPSLGPGSVDVRVSVDGTTTNAMPLLLSA